MGFWYMQENLNSDPFWAGDGQFCGGFLRFGILAPRDQTYQVFQKPGFSKTWGDQTYQVFQKPGTISYCTQELHFLRRISNKNLGNFGPRKVTRFL